MSLVLRSSSAGSRARPAFRPKRSTLISVAAVVAFLALWQVAPPLGWVNGRFTSQPSQVVLAAIDIVQSGDLLFHARISLAEFFLGFALALAVAIPLGALLGTSQVARDLIDPPMMALYVAPTLVLLPIMIVWLGIGMASKVAVVFLGALFPIAINTTAGIKETDVRLIRAARAFGGSRLDVFTKILIPASLPSILMGVRLAVGRGVLGVVVGEMFASQAGVGHQLETYGASMRIDDLLVYAIIISIFGYSLTVAVRALEARVRNWRPA